MEIREVYTTSKGTFWALSEALREKNRAKIYDSTGTTVYEKVKVEYALLSRDMVFKLSPIEVLQNDE